MTWLGEAAEVGVGGSPGGPGEGTALEYLRPVFCNAEIIGFPCSNGEANVLEPLLVAELAALTGFRDRGEGNNLTMLKTNS
jgi:hypothetical protein